MAAAMASSTTSLIVAIRIFRTAATPPTSVKNAMMGIIRRETAAVRTARRSALAVVMMATLARRIPAMQLRAFAKTSLPQVHPAMTTIFAQTRTYAKAMVVAPAQPKPVAPWMNAISPEHAIPWTETAPIPINRMVPLAPTTIIATERKIAKAACANREAPSIAMTVKNAPRILAIKAGIASILLYRRIPIVMIPIFVRSTTIALQKELVRVIRRTATMGMYARMTLAIPRLIATR